MHHASHGGSLVKGRFLIGIRHQADVVKGGDGCQGARRFQQGGYAGSVVIGPGRSGAGRSGGAMVVPVVHAYLGIVMRAYDKRFGMRGSSFFDSDEVAHRPVLHGAEFRGNRNVHGLARDGITHVLQVFFNVAGGTLHGAGLVGVPLSDGVRQMGHVRFQKCFRLVRLRNLPASAGGEKLGTGTQGNTGRGGEQPAFEEREGEIHEGSWGWLVFREYRG